MLYRVFQHPARSHQLLQIVNGLSPPVELCAVTRLFSRLLVSRPILQTSVLFQILETREETADAAAGD